MSLLTVFALFAVTAMLVRYALEDRSRWFAGVWPFGLVEVVWALVAVSK